MLHTFPTRRRPGRRVSHSLLPYGINAGLLDAAVYTPVVAAAWAGLSGVALQVCNPLCCEFSDLIVGVNPPYFLVAANLMQPSGVVGWCQSAADSPGPALQVRYIESPCLDLCDGDALNRRPAEFDIGFCVGQVGLVIQVLCDNLSHSLPPISLPPHIISNLSSFFSPLAK